MIVANKLWIQSLVVEILKNNQRNIYVFKKLGFEYLKETDDFIYYTKSI